MIHNFVLYTQCFPPSADPESYCTARFASALAAYGHQVTVVTPDRVLQMDDSVYRKLVDPRVRVVYVPVKRVAKKPFWSRLKYFNLNWDVANFGPCIKCLKDVLSQIEEPILITRSQPIDSLTIGWYCRKNAKKWIFHISDPLPSLSLKYTMQGHWLSVFGWFRYLSTKFWVRQGFKHADAFSVTCDHVLRYFKMMNPQHFDRIPSFVTTHIGDFKFKQNTEASSLLDPRIKGKVVVHPGVLYRSRQGFELIDAVERLNADGTPCTLLHAGAVDRHVRPRLEASEHAVLFEGESILMSAHATQRADVVFIPNYKIPYGYALRLMSKFVYQVYEDKPIVVCDYDDSPKHYFALKYPEAGIVWADITKPETLDAALKAAFAMDPSKIDRRAIRQEFSAEHIARQFTENVEKLWSK